MRTVNDINSVLKDFNKTPEQRKDFVNTLTESEMRNVFLEMCSVWAYDQKFTED